MLVLDALLFSHCNKTAGAGRDLQDMDLLPNDNTKGDILYWRQQLFLLT